jgi:hypothetical protein
MKIELQIKCDKCSGPIEAYMSGAVIYVYPCKCTETNGINSSRKKQTMEKSDNGCDPHVGDNPV